MAKIRELIKASNDSVKSKDELLLALHSIQFGDVVWREKSNFLVSMLSECVLVNANIDIIKALIDSAKFGKESDHNTVMLVAKLANDFDASPRVLNYVVTTLKLSLHEILETYTRYETIHEVKRVVTGFDNIIETLLTAFTSGSKDKSLRVAELKTVNFLAIKSYTENLNPECDIIERCNYELSSKQLSLKKPSYLSCKQGEGLHLLKTVKGGEDITKREEINIDLKSFNITDERNNIIDPDTGESSVEKIKINAKHISESVIATSSDSELQLMQGHTPSSKQIEIDIQRNRVWGPPNAIKEVNCPTGGGAMGPCRMLSCNCRNDDEEEESDLDDSTAWFTKSCDNCLIHIPNLCYAIRFPVTDGGWIGCYCSFKCMISSPPRTIFHDVEIALDRVQEQIDSYGIMDRS